MIANMQVLRALAALAVVFDHTAYRLGPKGVVTEFHAVAIFFAISGFVMTYIPQKTSLEFVASRFCRIVPFYWLLTIAFFVWIGTGLINLPYTIPALRDQFSQGAIFPARFLLANFASSATTERLVQLAKSLVFIPQGTTGGPVLGVGWSLNLEIMYYLVFAVALSIHRKAAPLIVIGMLLALQAVSGLWFNELWRWIFSNNINFVAGIVVFYIWTAIPKQKLVQFRLVILPAAALFLIMYVLSHIFIDYPSLRFAQWPFAVVLVALILESAGFRPQWAGIILLGDASYSLYLSHVILRETVRPLGQRWPGLDVSLHVIPMLGLVAASVVVGLLVHAHVERPVIKAARRLLQGNRSTSPARPDAWQAGEVDRGVLASQTP